ncbi:hypothetical protein CARUB_v10007657mg [Capsella rubella]|uniref:Uncharacterized protein n=1 Tax=Capsella rubella TaxID=81985 RepID=R0F3D2_9BRAS|nr:hypothetical protein CARUB_v10007657mg [Capsella rubella]
MTIFVVSTEIRFDHLLWITVHIRIKPNRTYIKPEFNIYSFKYKFGDYILLYDPVNYDSLVSNSRYISEKKKK